MSLNCDLYIAMKSQQDHINHYETTQFIHDGSIKKVNKYEWSKLMIGVGIFNFYVLLVYFSKIFIIYQIVHLVEFYGILKSDPIIL